MGSLEISWTRPYRLPPDEQSKLAQGPMPAARGIDAAAAVLPASDMLHLPAPVLQYIQQQAAVGGGAGAAAAALQISASATPPPTELLFVATMPQE
jgi:hypothetical protein